VTLDVENGTIEYSTLDAELVEDGSIAAQQKKKEQNRNRHDEYHSTKPCHPRVIAIVDALDENNDGLIEQQDIEFLLLPLYDQDVKQARAAAIELCQPNSNADNYDNYDDDSDDVDPCMLRARLERRLQKVYDKHTGDNVVDKEQRQLFDTVEQHVLGKKQARQQARLAVRAGTDEARVWTVLDAVDNQGNGCIGQDAIVKHILLPMCDDNEPAARAACQDMFADLDDATMSIDQLQEMLHSLLLDPQTSATFATIETRLQQRTPTELN
jgi:hypothetical protein